jgi:hypothetical protein
MSKCDGRPCSIGRVRNSRKASKVRRPPVRLDFSANASSSRPCDANPFMTIGVGTAVNRMFRAWDVALDKTDANNRS